jgi:flagella basal body P-ring formation protein FlgA
MIKRGEIVTVIAQSKGITITTKGKALENGYYNSAIRVLNMKSGKVFSGTVSGYGKVNIVF